MPASLLAFLMAAAAGLALAPALCPMLRRLSLERVNYQGRPVCSGGGLLFWGVAACWLLPHPGPLERCLTAAAVGFGLLGFLDDRWGSPQFKGLRGHLGALRSGRVTTGLVKAVGGIALAGLIAWQLDPSPAAGIAALLIALCANAFNLLDLRPLRTLKAFWVLGSALLWAAPVPLALLLGLSLPYARLEAKREVMLGDTGANALGAAVGVGAIAALPFWAQAASVALLLLFHAWAERHSLSAWIEHHTWARAVDGWGWRTEADA